MIKKVVISPGHGKNVAGASSIIDEVAEARKVVPCVAEYLRTAGVEVIEYYENTATNQSDNLNAIVKYHNSQTRDLDVSVHLNASSKTDNPMGVEVLYYSEAGLAAEVSKAIVNVSGLKNRGAKERKDLYFLNGTAKPAILIEVCFVDSSADVKLYQDSLKAICKAIAEAISGKKLMDSASGSESAGIGAASFSSLSKAEIAGKVIEIIKHYAISAGLFPSVKTAQMLLESDYLKSELSVAANNCYGMKTSLSSNAWPGSTWDGVSKYTKQTQENKSDGTAYTVLADFRKYQCIEDSIQDHSAYLLGAKNGTALRYAGITQCKNYREQVQLIKDGGYATDVQYVKKICDIIEQYGLDKYDTLMSALTLAIDDQVISVEGAENIAGRWCIDVPQLGLKQVAIRDVLVGLGYRIVWEESSKTIVAAKNGFQ